MDLEALDRELAPWRARRVDAARARIRALERLGPLGERKAKWWRRHKLYVRPYAARRAECGREGFEGVCEHCGVVERWVVGCGAVQVCADCARRRAARQARAIEAGLSRSYARARAAYYAAGRPAGGYPVLTLLTFTLDHEGSLEERRRLLTEAWNRWRTWYQERHGGRMSYAWAVEVTAGRDGKGHPHLHVVCCLPLVDYRALSAAWARATGGRSTGVHCSRTACSAPKKAARYLAKYASKGVKTLPVQLAAEWIEAQHQRRAVSTSRDWRWEPEHGPWTVARMAGSLCGDRAGASSSTRAASQTTPDEAPAQLFGGHDASSARAGP